MPSATGSGTAGPASTPDPAVAFVEPIWATKIIPTILAKAVDAGTLLPEIHANPDAAGEKYGRREATNPFNYVIKGSGKVTQVNTQSRAGTMAVEVDTGNGHSRETINLQIGPVVIGTALRDATGLVSFNQFTNQIDFAGISKEMNSRAIKEALAGRDPAPTQSWGRNELAEFDRYLQKPSQLIGRQPVGLLTSYRFWLII
jgi:predicted lipoprotein